jgi:hypothetical protein
MAKLTLTLAPTFNAVVKIPVPGKSAEPVRFTFKGRTRDDFRQFMDSLTSGEGRMDEDVIMDIASGWELDDPFDRPNVAQLLQTYIGAARAVIETYISELSAARAKN